MMRKALFMVMAILISVGIAAAWSNLNISPNSQSIDIGTYGYYVLTLDSNKDMSILNWVASDPSIETSIDNGSGYPPDSQIGSVAISYTGGSGPKTYNMRVKPVSGATLNNSYDITVTGIDAYGVAKASVTGSSIPAPEAATGVLMSAGLLGLVGFMRYRRN
jgi:hypothetical protein